MLPGWFVVVSVCIRLMSGGQYAWAVLKGKAEPNPVTWFLWGLTPMIAFAAQLQKGLTTQSIVLLALGLTPLIIFCLGAKKNGITRYLTPFSVGCGSIALVGIVLWQITARPELAITFCIAADIFATLPTLQKAYKDRSSEYPFPYILSITSMCITLLTIKTWAFTTFAFPLYMLCINVVILGFVVLPLKETVQLLRTRLTPEAEVEPE